MYGCCVEPKTVSSETPWNTQHFVKNESNLPIVPLRSGSSDDFSGSPTYLWASDSAKSTANFSTLQGINISHLGKRKIIFKMAFLGDMLVSWRVSKQCNHSEQITHRYHKSCIDPHKMGNWMTLDDKWYDLGTQDYHKGLKNQHKLSSLIDPQKTQPNLAEHVFSMELFLHAMSTPSVLSI